VNLIFTNPWGFLALLGIPLLILIHYLRRRAKVVTVSTLFLLKRTQRESKAGRRFETFSNSLPFWLQIFAVLLLTWILVKPRYGNSRVTQQIAIVLDSSASMQSLREGFVEKLRPHLESMSGGADHASYIVLDHNPRRGRIYQGDDAEELLERLRDWNPTDGALDPTRGVWWGQRAWSFISPIMMDPSSRFRPFAFRSGRVGVIAASPACPLRKRMRDRFGRRLSGITVMKF
jgi:hypothetical protein